jgi:hypothetical protein
MGPQYSPAPSKIKLPAPGTEKARKFYMYAGVNRLLNYRAGMEIHVVRAGPSLSPAKIFTFSNAYERQE